MVVIHGKRMFGKCDVVPELFYVGTWMYHIDYLPIVPLGSRLVLKEEKGRYHSIKIPFSLKSLFYAWSRAAFFLGGIIAYIFLVVCLVDPQTRREIGIAGPAIWSAVCTVGFVIVMLYPRKRQPSYERACQLAKLAKLSDIGWAALNVQYGRMATERPAEMQFQQ